MDKNRVKYIECFTADSLCDLNRKVREWQNEHPEYVITSGGGGYSSERRFLWNNNSV